MATDEYLENMPWYLKGSRQQAEQILSNEDPGSFIIRPSSQASCLALSHKVSNGKIGHALIHNNAQGFRLEQTQNSFPSLELLVLSIKKHFTTTPNIVDFGKDFGNNSTTSPSGSGISRLSTHDPNRGKNINELSEMFPNNPRESIVTALQLAGGNSERAADLMLSEELYTNDQQNGDSATAAMSTMIASSIPELQPKIEELRDAVNKIPTYQELKQKVQLGKAVADIKKALADYPMTSTRAKPEGSPPGQGQGSQNPLPRFKNSICWSVWEILCKMDGIAKQIKTPAYSSKVASVCETVKTVRETLEAVEPLLKAAPANQQEERKRGPKSDEEFYIDVDEIVMEKEIGKGAYGKVYKGTYRGRVVAVKTIEVKDEKELVLIRREISLLRECDHLNITELIGVSKKSDMLLLVMEYVDRGELYKILLDTSIEIDWPLRLKIANDVASGLAHVHSKNLIHRDIKSENLLVDSKWNVKLCDFGFARAVSHGLHRYTMCGSMYFNAPELLLGKPYDAKADVFAYGIFLCELITRGSINLERTKQTAFGLDVKALEKHIPKDCPPLFWKVAFCCCTYNPQRRPSMAQVEKMLAKIRGKYA